MELLVIIYWSLIGFGILALTIILTSYVTYQIRKRLGNIPLESNRSKIGIKKILVKVPDKNSKIAKQHHPRVVKRKFHVDDPRNRHQNSKDRITILNDQLKKDDSDHNRFRNN